MIGFDAMTAQELAREAARCMGLDFVMTARGVRLREGNVFARSFDPANRLDDAAELGDKFLAAFPAVSFQVTKHNASVFRAYLFTELGPAWRADNASEARARTVACLKAWAALNAK